MSHTINHTVSAKVFPVSAGASSRGKTAVTAGLTRKLHQQGYKVRVFKTGPDFLDPKILERANGAQVYNLDL